MSYSEKVIGTIGVEDEGNWGQKTGITVKVDSLDKATIRFGDSYTLRISEEDVDALRELLHDAGRELMYKRAARAVGLSARPVTDDSTGETNDS